MLTVLIIVDETVKPNFDSKCISIQPTDKEKIIGDKIYDFLKSKIAPMFEHIINDVPPTTVDNRN